MKRLGLFRHAKSDWHDAKARDFDRGLNERGRKGAVLMGKHIVEHGIRWQRIVASPAVRVAETIELASQAVGTTIPVQWDRRIYLASSVTLADVLREVPDAVESVLMVGHNPEMSELAQQLCGRSRIDELHGIDYVVFIIPGLICYALAQSNKIPELTAAFAKPGAAQGVAHRAEGAVAVLGRRRQMVGVARHAVADHLGVDLRAALLRVFEILGNQHAPAFAEHQADLSIVEVGLGGRHDATNVFTFPAATVISPTIRTTNDDPVDDARSVELPTYEAVRVCLPTVANAGRRKVAVP
mgnify:CR=1 FL=1